MESLVWYSIPGMIIVSAISVVSFPVLKSLDASKIPIIAISAAFLIPTIGFITHQLMRVLFEGTGGFSRKSRLVLDEICNWAKTVHSKGIDHDKAFLIWESAFYGDEKLPERFITHNRSVWHYILSFWGVSLASLLSFIATTSFFVSNKSRMELLISSIFSFVFFIMFLIKGFQTYKSLNNQEKMMFWRNSKIFKDHLDAVVRESPNDKAGQQY